MSQEITKLFLETKADGTPKYGDLDFWVIRSLMLIEMLKAAGSYEAFPAEHKFEMALLIDGIGITGQTPPEAVTPMIVNYFKGLKDFIHPELFLEIDRIKRRGDVSKADKLAAIADAFRSMTDKEGPTAPMHDEKAPEDSKRAQSLSLSLGWKVRI